MPDLEFRIAAAEPASCGLTPLLKFRVDIANRPAQELIQSIMLQAQIQIRAPRRGYTPQEQEKLVELFGVPVQWGHTLRNRLWANANTVVSKFSGSTTAHLHVPCTYDLNIAATKYCYALEQGDVPLLFLFSGTIFYLTAEGRLQVQQIPWSQEAAYRMPVSLWRQIMDEHYPNSAWLYLNRGVFDQLYAYKRSRGLATWEQTVEQLLAPTTGKEPVPA